MPEGGRQCHVAEPARTPSDRPASIRTHGHPHSSAAASCHAPLVRQIKELRRSLASAQDQITTLEEEVATLSKDSSGGGNARDHLSLAVSHMIQALKMLLRLNAGRDAKLKRKNSSVGLGGTLPMEDWPDYKGTCIFFPVAGFKESWDTCVMFLILYSAVTVPFRVCFGAEVRGEHPRVGGERSRGVRQGGSSGWSSVLGLLTRRRSGRRRRATRGSSRSR